MRIVVPESKSHALKNAFEHLVWTVLHAAQDFPDKTNNMDNKTSALSEFRFLLIDTV